MTQSITTKQPSRKFNWSSWQVLIVGAVVALLVAVLMMQGLMQAPLSDVTALVTTLTVTSLVSLAVGYFLFRFVWKRSPSFYLTLVLTYAWAGILTLFNVWIMSMRMFASPHDLLLSGILLAFAAIVATSFGVFVAANLNRVLSELADSAQQIADGNFEARVAVKGRDEVARAGSAFNEMADQLQEGEAQRAELEKLRRDLIAWTSHDLRTPLTSIRAMIEALHDGVVTDPETTQRYYRTMRSDIIALNTLLDDLFELAQLDAGGLVIELSPHSLSDMISDSLEGFQALAAQKNIRLSGEIGENLDPVNLNAAKIGRVLSNLLSNALRYTPADGQVHVRAYRTPEGAIVTVQDSGPGFEPEDLPRVFEQFYRGEMARSRATGGAGLGLAIAQGIVEAHNGRIWAENAPQGGAMIGFMLPNMNPIHE